jgi:hypothetical protein
MRPSRVGFVAATIVFLLLSNRTASAAAPSGLASPEVQADGKITFRLRAPKAEKVSVICEAVGTQPMTKDAEGVWSVTVGPVPPGIYDCQFDKEVKDYAAKLQEVCPNGIDVYFDNVGGPLTDAVFTQINVGTRLVVCGQIDQYNATRPPRGPRLLWHLIVKQARAEGFLVFQFASRFPEGQQQVAQWIKKGRVKYQESIVEGLDSAPKAFIGLFHGENIGKQLVRVAEEQ